MIRNTSSYRFIMYVNLIHLDILYPNKHFSQVQNNLLYCNKCAFNGMFTFRKGKLNDKYIIFHI